VTSAKTTISRVKASTRVDHILVDGIVKRTRMGPETTYRGTWCGREALSGAEANEQSKLEYDKQHRHSELRVMIKEVGPRQQEGQITGIVFPQVLKSQPGCAFVRDVELGGNLRRKNGGRWRIRERESERAQVR